MRQLASARWQFALLAATVFATGTTLVLAREGPEPLIRIRDYGGMAIYYNLFELRTDGTVELSRSAPGGALLERRGLRLPPEDTQRMRQLLEESGYLSANASELQLEAVQKAAAGVPDLGAWKVEVFRGKNESVTAVVPSQYMEQFYPELREIPYVLGAWALIRELGGLWEHATLVVAQ
jgi:hypothetical protein